MEINNQVDLQLTAISLQRSRIELKNCFDNAIRKYDIKKLYNVIKQISAIDGLLIEIGKRVEIPYLGNIKHSEN